MDSCASARFIFRYFIANAIQIEGDLLLPGEKVSRGREREDQSGGVEEMKVYLLYNGSKHCLVVLTRKWNRTTSQMFRASRPSEDQTHAL